MRSVTSLFAHAALLAGRIRLPKFAHRAGSCGLPAELLILTPLAARTSQLHFHSPSEHTINGVHYPLEMHIVNQNWTTTNNVTASGGTPGAVIAIMFQYNPANLPNTFLAPLLTSAYYNTTAPVLAFSSSVTPAKGNLTQNAYQQKQNSVEFAKTAAPLDLNPIIAAADPSTYYKYPGTLTTPGCNNVVTFYVLPTPVNVSFDQVVAFTNLLAEAQGGISRGADNRPPNPVLSTTTVQMSKAAIKIQPAPPTCTPSSATLPKSGGAVHGRSSVLVAVVAAAATTIMFVAMSASF